MVRMVCNVQECCAWNGRYISFLFQPSIVDDSRAKSDEVNAFSELMALGTHGMFAVVLKFT